MAALADVITRFVLLDTQVGCKVCTVFQVPPAENLILTFTIPSSLRFSRWSVPLSCLR